MADNTLLNTGSGGDTIRDVDRSGIKTQIVGLDAGIGGTESLVNFSNPLPVQPAAAYFVFSTVNTTTTQLATTATFTGTIESITSQPAISILLTSDQPGILTLKEYIDLAGTRVCNTIVEAIVASVPFSESYTANGNYFNLTFQNTGPSTTTTLNINTAFGTLPPVTSLGNSQVSLNEVNGFNFATSTKGVQTANILPVQQPKDSGRNARIFMLDAYTAAPVAEALQTVVQWYGNAAVAGTTTPAVVPAGKILRLTSISLSTKSLATVGSAVLRIRANTAGIAVIGSPLVYSVEAGTVTGATTIAETGGMGITTITLPDGLEFPAGTGLGFTLAGYGPTGTLTLEGVTRFVVTGFEY